MKFLVKPVERKSLADGCGKQCNSHSTCASDCSFKFAYSQKVNAK